MDRWRLSGASGVSEVLNDAASISEVGTMPPGSWQSRWSERRHRTSADGRRLEHRRFSLACVFVTVGDGTDLSRHTPHDSGGHLKAPPHTISHKS